MECAICKVTNPLVLKEKFQAYSLWHCQNCAGQFWTPMKNPGSDWYQHDERYAWRNKNPYQFVESNHQEFLSDLPAPHGTLLDIGMGTGNFLKAALGYGYQGYGIDFDEEAVRVARESLGLKNIYAADIDGALRQFGANYFNSITMFEVLEHLENPNDFMEKVKILLKSGGFLALSVPYRNSWDRFKKYDKPPRHLTRWDKNSLSKFLSRHQFNVVRLKVIPVSLSYLITKFHFWTTGLLSFGLVQKISASRATSKSSLLASPAIKLARFTARFKDYLLFFVPSLLLYCYLALIKKHGLTLYSLAKRN